jgi:hypothetical protein
MTAPRNQQEYLERFARGQSLEGFGLETTCVVPCPFCAAPDFARWRVIDAHDAMAKPATCKECGRSAKSIFTRNAGGVSFEIVQCGGADQPDWLMPKMRRVPDGVGT